MSAGMTMPDSESMSMRGAVPTVPLTQGARSTAPCQELPPRYHLQGAPTVLPSSTVSRPPRSSKAVSRKYSAVQVASSSSDGDAAPLGGNGRLPPSAQLLRLLLQPLRSSMHIMHPKALLGSLGCFLGMRAVWGKLRRTAFADGRPAKDTATTKCTAILWFRNDLRLHDHAALIEANSANLPSVLPVYCFDPREYGKDDSGFDKTGIQRAQFIVDSVKDLRTGLRALGSDLLIRIGRPEDVLPSLAKETQAEAVYCHMEVTTEEAQVEASVQNSLAAQGAELWASWGGTVYHLEDLPFELHSKFKVEASVQKSLAAQGAELRASWGGTLYHLEDLPFDLSAMPGNYADFHKQLASLECLGFSNTSSTMSATTSTSDNFEQRLQELRHSTPLIGLTHCHQGGESEGLKHMNLFMAELSAHLLPEHVLCCAGKALSSALGGEHGEVVDYGTAMAMILVMDTDRNSDTLVSFLVVMDHGTATAMILVILSHGPRDSYGFSCHISPWLAMGCLSPRQMYSEMVRWLGPPQPGASGRLEVTDFGMTGRGVCGAAFTGGKAEEPWSRLMFELLWRDFFRLVTRKLMFELLWQDFFRLVTRKLMFELLWQDFFRLVTRKLMFELLWQDFFRLVTRKLMFELLWQDFFRLVTRKLMFELLWQDFFRLVTRKLMFELLWQDFFRLVTRKLMFELLWQDFFRLVTRKLMFELLWQDFFRLVTRKLMFELLWQDFFRLVTRKLMFELLWQDFFRLVTRKLMFELLWQDFFRLVTRKLMFELLWQDFFRLVTRKLMFELLWQDFFRLVTRKLMFELLWQDFFRLVTRKLMFELLWQDFFRLVTRKLMFELLWQDFFRLVTRKLMFELLWQDFFRLVTRKLMFELLWQDFFRLVTRKLMFELLWQDFFRLVTRKLMFELLWQDFFRLVTRKLMFELLWQDFFRLVTRKLMFELLWQDFFRLVTRKLMFELLWQDFFRLVTRKLMFELLWQDFFRLVTRKLMFELLWQDFFRLVTRKLMFELLWQDFFRLVTRKYSLLGGEMKQARGSSKKLVAY
eukprot:gene17197-23516_t